MQVKQYSGMWWLSENPEKKIHGNLIHHVGHLPILSLEGAFIEKKEEGEFYETILGLVDSKKITLIDCVRLNFSDVNAGAINYFRSKYNVTLLLIGKYFPKKSEIEFKYVNVKFSNIKEWLTHSLFSVSHLEENDSETIWQINKPLEKQIQLDQFTIKITGVIESSHSFFLDTFPRDVLISIHAQKMSLQKVIEIINSLRNFFEVLIGQNVLIRHIFYYEGEDFKKISAICPFFEKSRYNTHKTVPHPVEFESISQNLQTIFQNWFSFAQKYEPVYDLFFSLANERGYVRTPFLVLSQAIEAYHSRKYDNKLFSDDIRKEIDGSTQFSKKMCEVIAEPLREPFKHKMKYVNRKSLSMQIKELFEQNQVFKIFVKDEKQFIRQFVDTRNYLTHYDPEITEPPTEQSKIPFLTDTLRFMIISIILKEIGLKESEIERAIKIYYAYRITDTYSLF